MRSDSTPRAVSMMIGSLALLFLRPQAPADLDARKKRQHPVQDDKIGCLFFSEKQSLLTIAGKRRAKSVTLQIVSQQLRLRRFVFDDENEWIHNDWLTMIPVRQPV